MKVSIDYERNIVPACCDKAKNNGSDRIPTSLVAWTGSGDLHDESEDCWRMEFIAHYDDVYRLEIAYCPWCGTKLTRPDVFPEASNFIATMRQELEAAFRSGGERKMLLELVQQYKDAASAYEGATEFLAWLQEAEAFLSRPIPPLDESKLPIPPTSRNAPGYISVAEARASSLAKKSGKP